MLSARSTPWPRSGKHAPPTFEIDTVGAIREACFEIDALSGIRLEIHALSEIREACFETYDFAEIQMAGFDIDASEVREGRFAIDAFEIRKACFAIDALNEIREARLDAVALSETRNASSEIDAFTGLPGNSRHD